MRVPSLAMFLSWADQICAAVGFAHASAVVHRDLKPANSMVTAEGVIKVLDFGIAKIEDTSLTQTGLVVGTPSYMSPEQLTGKKVNHRADIFALGSVFYELVTRERPFQGDVTGILYKIVHEEPMAPSLVNPAIPGGIDAVIRRALAKDPKDRFQTCEQMRTAFAEQGARMHVSPVETGPAPIPRTKPRPQPAPAPPSFLLPESGPKRRDWWPIALMLLFLAVAGWASYVHTTTGCYPAFVTRLVGTSRQLPQTVRDSTSTTSSGRSQPNAMDQNEPRSNPEAWANNPGPVAAPDNSAGTATETVPEATSVSNPSSPAAGGRAQFSPE